MQSVLAVAGAGLFAVAAIVFTFLNPDLTDFATRTTIVAGVTVVFLGAAWLLARQGLRFSSETVGALGLVFVGLDIWALSTLADPASASLVAAAAATAVGAVALTVIAVLAHVRAWLWAALVGFLLTPALLGYAAGGWGTVVGHVFVGVVAVAAHAGISRLRVRFPGRLEHVTATVVQVVVTVVVPCQLLWLVSPEGSGVPAGSAILGSLALLSALATRQGAARAWSLTAGALAVSAVALLPLAVPLYPVWYIAVLPLAAGLALLAFAAAVAAAPAGVLPPVDRGHTVAGGWVVLLLAAVPALAVASAQLLVPGQLTDFEPGLAAMAALAAAGLASAATARLVRATDPPLAAAARTIAAWSVVPLLLTLAGWAALLPVARVAIALACAVLLVGLALRTPLRRAPLVVGAHLLLVVGAATAWTDRPWLSLVGGAAAVVVVLVLARTAPVGWRALYTAVAYAYALVVVARGLDLARLELVAVLCLVTSLASVLALAATVARRLPVRHWYAILGVTAVPFLIGIVSVLTVRSGWTALSTAVTFALALTLVVSRREGVTRELRSMAAALLVPSIAVVVVCLGAQLLALSGSPVVLPVIAAIVAAVLPCLALIENALARRGLEAAEANAVRWWIEASTLVTAVLAVLLALVRSAAGLPTTLLVLLIVGVGAATAAVVLGRRRYWSFAGASFTGALWTVWALLGVTELEPYVLPPAVVAAVVGCLLTARGLRARGLAVAGLAFAVAPPLLQLALPASSEWMLLRGGALLAVALLLLWMGLRGSRSDRAAAALAVPLLAFSLLAAAGGAALAARFGLGLESSGDTPSMVPALGFAFAAGAVGVAAARGLSTTMDAASPRRRWLLVPPFLYTTAGPMTAIAGDWFSIWTLWTLMAVLLGVMVATVRQPRTTLLPPVAFQFALAWVVGVTGWSERELRVETFSLPLGLALVAAGVVGMRGPTDGAASLARWPRGFAGSWRLLGPGLVVTFLPSVLSTGTDPLTWRAVLVIALALVAILVGSLRRLAAPFLLGIVVLPIENVVVFAVQVGRSIGAAPWWITLATAGAVLLVIAVTTERRGAAAGGGFGARLRDLR